MKKAFTMIELIFVIVVIGILAAVMIPSTRTNPLQEAAIQVLSHIRYTQHLALIDDKYDSNDTNWYKGRWQIEFSNSNAYADNKPGYTIFADQDYGSGYGGNAIEDEMAKNPENSNQVMTGGYGSTAAINYTNSGFKGMKKLNLGNSYGVASVEFSNECDGSNGSALRISFDSLGRPFEGDSSGLTSPYTAATDRLIRDDCNIVLKDSADHNVTITIRPETGYASITQY